MLGHPGPSGWEAAEPPHPPDLEEEGEGEERPLSSSTPHPVARAPEGQRYVQSPPILQRLACTCHRGGPKPGLQAGPGRAGHSVPSLPLHSHFLPLFDFLPHAVRVCARAHMRNVPIYMIHRRTRVNVSSMSAGICCPFYSPVYLRCSEQCLAHNRCSRNFVERTTTTKNKSKRPSCLLLWHKSPGPRVCHFRQKGPQGPLSSSPAAQRGSARTPSSEGYQQAPACSAVGHPAFPGTPGSHRGVRRASILPSCVPHCPSQPCLSTVALLSPSTHCPVCHSPSPASLRVTPSPPALALAQTPPGVSHEVPPHKDLAPSVRGGKPSRRKTLSKQLFFNAYF